MVRLIAYFTLFFLLAACAQELQRNNPELDAEGRSRRPIALFDLVDQEKLPWPNVLAQSKVVNGEAVIGPINLPNPDNNPVIAQINTLSGFTQLPVITADFSAEISAASIRPNENVILLDGFASQLPFSFRFDAQLNKLFIYPDQPLAPNLDHVVIVTKSLKGVNGLPVQEDLFFRLTKYREPLYDAATGRVLSDLLSAQDVAAEDAEQLEALRKAYQENFFGAGPIPKLIQSAVRADLVRGTGRDKSDPAPDEVTEHFALAWAFRTAGYANGNPTATLHEARKRIAEADAPVADFAVATTISSENGLDAYYEKDVPRSNIHMIAEGNLTSLDFFEGETWAEPLGAGLSSSVSVLIAYPRAITEGPVDVVIFQHGFKSCKRRAVLAIANVLAARGMATIGIDAPEHGTRAGRNDDPDNDDEAPGTCDRVIEGKLIRSGEGFARFDNIAATRDYLRQTVVDQTALARAIREGAIGLHHANDFTTVRFGGQSMGGIIGALFLDVEPTVAVGVLNVAGAWLSRLFVESDDLSADLLPALAKELNHDSQSAAFQDVLWKLVPLFQGLLDPADPAYYAENLASSIDSGAKRVLLQQVDPDEVVPAIATVYLGRLANLPEFDEPAQIPSGGTSGWTLFSGDVNHSLLTHPHDPAVDGENFLHAPMMQAMQEQFSFYLASDGFDLRIR